MENNNLPSDQELEGTSLVDNQVPPVGFVEQEDELDTSINDQMPQPPKIETTPEIKTGPTKVEDLDTAIKKLIQESPPVIKRGRRVV